MTPSDSSTASTADPRGPGLGRVLNVNPLAPFAAMVPLAVAVAIMSSPVPVLWVLGAGMAMLVLADLRRGPVLALAILALACTIGALLAVSAPLTRVGVSPSAIDLPGLHLQRNQVLAGLRLGGKVGAALSLFVTTGLLATPQDLLRSTVRYLHVPYRVAYAGVAAIGFRQRYSQEYAVIREAHALRGTRTRVPFLRPLVRWWSAVPALMVAAIRHAERLSMSMDARGFGAYRTRTERSQPRWRLRDSVIVLVGWFLAVLIIMTFSGSGVVIHDL